MTKPAIAISFLAMVTLASAPLAASAGSCTSVTTQVMLRNTSDRDVWADVSWAYKTTRWNIYKTFCITPKSQYAQAYERYNHPELGPQVRVRAEIKQGDCRSRTQRTLSSDIRTINTNGGRNCHPQIHANISGTNGSYNLRLTQQY